MKQFEYNKLNAELKDTLENLKGLFTTIFNDQIIINLSEKLEGKDTTTNFYDIIRQTSKEYDCHQKITAPLPDSQPNEPEPIMLHYLLHINNLFKHICDIIYKYFESPANAINLPGKKDLPSLITELSKYNYPSSDVLTLFNEIFSSSKCKVCLNLFCLFSFICFVNDKSFLPASCPYLVHQLDTWLVADVMNYAVSHNQMYSYKVSTGYTVNEKGMLFFESLFSEILIPILKYNGGSKQYFVSDVLIEYFFQLSLLLDIIKKTDTSNIITAINSITGYPPESIFKVILHLISSYDQKEAKKYFGKMAKIYYFAINKDLRDIGLILLSGGWSFESAANLIISCIKSESIPQISQQICSILSSKSESSKGLQVICIRVLNQIMGLDSKLTAACLIKSDLFTSLKYLCFLDNDNKDRSVLYDYANPYLSSIFKSRLNYDIIENSIEAIKVLLTAENKHIASMCCGVMQPLFKLYSTKGNFVVEISKEIEDIIINILTLCDDPSTVIATIIDTPLSSYIGDLSILEGINKNEFKIVKQISSEDIKEMQNGDPKSKNSSKNSRHSMDFIPIEEYWNIPVKLSYEIECLSNGKLNFKHSTVPLQSHLLQYFSDSVLLELWLSYHESLFSILMKLPNSIQSQVFPSLFQKYLQQLTNAESIKSLLTKKTRLSLIQNLDANICSFMSCREETTRSIINKVFTHFNVQSLPEINEYMKILTSMISSNDTSVQEKGVDLINAFIKYIDCTSKLFKEYMLSLYPLIIALTISGNSHIDETVYNLKETLYHHFESDISELITPNKLSVLNWMKRVFSSNDNSTSAIALSEVGLIFKNCKSNYPFSFNDVKELWEIISPRLHSIESSTEVIMEICLYFTDECLNLICAHIRILLTQLDEERLHYFVELINYISQDKKMICKTNHCLKECIDCLQQCLKVLNTPQIREKIFNTIPEFAKSAGVDTMAALCSIVKEYAVLENDAYSCVKIVDMMLHTWPNESAAMVSELTGYVEILMKYSSPEVKSACESCMKMLQKGI